MRANIIICAILSLFSVAIHAVPTSVRYAPPTLPECIVPVIGVGPVCIPRATPTPYHKWNYNSCWKALFMLPLFTGLQIRRLGVEGCGGWNMYMCMRCPILQNYFWRNVIWYLSWNPSPCQWESPLARGSLYQRNYTLLRGIWRAGTK